MSEFDLEDILQDALGCYNDGRDKCGEHRIPWPCERLTTLMGDVEDWADHR